MITTNTHVVQKPFMVGKRHLRSGQEVDASGWRNTRQLVSTRYLAPIMRPSKVMAPDTNPEATQQIVEPRVSR